MIRLAILGSTGSIGRQTLAVVREYPNLFSVEVLTAGSNWELLASQACQFNADKAVIATPDCYGSLREALRGTSTKAMSGMDTIEQVVCEAQVDVVVVAIVGFAGLGPTLAAIGARKRVALANKECLVAAGPIVMELCQAMGVELMPIDSEHSAIFQCLVGELSPVHRVLLTASGGSVRDVDKDKLHLVTPSQVLCHPVWSMGARITVDSATMLNKGFEVIEAAHLFRLAARQIEVVIHPESIIHSAVEFVDGSIKAQMSYPDMRLPIQYALTYPERMDMEGVRWFNPFETSQLNFASVDTDRYPCLQLAFNALAGGGILPAALNAAGEVAVEAFLSQRIGFTDIATIIDRTLCGTINEPLRSVSQVFEADAVARYVASGFVEEIYKK